VFTKEVGGCWKHIVMSNEISNVNVYDSEVSHVAHFKLCVRCKLFAPCMYECRKQGIASSLSILTDSC